MKQLRSPFFGMLVQVATDQKEKIKSDKKEESEPAKKRLEVVRGVLQRLADAEKDPEMKKEFDKTMKKNFE